MSITTVAELTDRTGVAIVADWAAEVEIPVLTGRQRQGDVLVVPDTAAAATTLVPSTGTPVVRGESGGNTHAIHADPGSGVCCDVQEATTEALTVATLVVPAGAEAWLAHPEHGFLGIAPGTYRIKRQREMAEIDRVVSD